MTVGRDICPAALGRFLRRAGYVLDERVDEPGEAAFRGEVTEIYPGDRELPYRIEIDGVRVTAVRRYDPASQRSVDEVEALSIAPVSELPPERCEDPGPGAEHRIAQAWGEMRTLPDACGKARVTVSPAADAARRAILTQIREDRCRRDGRIAEGRGDVLLATSIIESGLDVPRANTMVVLRPGLFGLAQVHQLRGRVGRGNAQACCFLAPEPGEELSDPALKRLGTLQALDPLGAGMAISAQDLDLRGAGDLFGEKQAGHVKLIGLALYQELLPAALREARGETVDGEPSCRSTSGAACPPATSRRRRCAFNLYHRLARARDPADVRALSDEVADRFGPPPPAVEELLRLARIRALGRSLGIARVSAGPEAVAVSFAGDIDFAREFGNVLERLAPDLE